MRAALLLSAALHGAGAIAVAALATSPPLAAHRAEAARQLDVLTVELEHAPSIDTGRPLPTCTPAELPPPPSPPERHRAAPKRAPARLSPAAHAPPAQAPQALASPTSPVSRGAAPTLAAPSGASPAAAVAEGPKGEAPLPSPTTNSSAAPQAAAPPGGQGSASGAPDASGGADDIGGYGQSLLAKLAANVIYPEAAERARLEGTIVILLVLEASGRVLSVSVVNDAGSPLLAEAALAAARRASPFAPLPRRMAASGSPVPIEIPLRFHLRR